MKVARLYCFNDIRIEDVSVPDVGQYDALIKTKASGICSGDVMSWYIEKKAPLILGHEPSGEIVQIGNAVKDFKVGDRVAVHHHAPCLKCRFCQRGDYVQCDVWWRSKIIPGGISEYILIPQLNLQNDTLKMPDNISFEDGALVEPTACVVKSLRRSGIMRGDTVLVIGLGVMGLIHVLTAREFGADKVIATDYVSYRRQKAIEFGADAVFDPSDTNLKEAILDTTKGKMADIVIVCPNTVQAMTEAFNYVSAGGTITLFTPAKPAETLTIDPNDLYFKDIKIVTSYSCGPNDTRLALQLISNSIVTAKHLVTHKFSIDETLQAYQMTARATESLKCMIVFT